MGPPPPTYHFEETSRKNLPMTETAPVPVGLAKKASSTCTNSKALVRSDSASEKASTAKRTGRWTREEHFRFLEALKLFGKEWKRV